MPTEPSSNVKFEIGHVWFIDIVGYSKLLITDQSERLQRLKEIVWGTEYFPADSSRRQITAATDWRWWGSGVWQQSGAPVMLSYGALKLFPSGTRSAAIRAWSKSSRC